MKREYPYLHDEYFTNTNTENKVKRSILKDIEEFVNQRQYIRLTLLDWNENPIREIQGEVSSGSLSKVAQSPVRRSGNLSIAIDAGSYNIDDSKADFAINKKIYIELGVRNDTDKYPDYPIFWFPEGVFFIGSFAINSSSNGATNISLTLKDKMAMLNGEIGGVLPAVTYFDSMDTQLPDGTYASRKVLIYNIIQEMVNHYGKEPLNNIVIEDVPLRIRRVLQWKGESPIYLIYKPLLVNGATTNNFVFTLEEPPAGTNYQIFYAGDDVGYIRDDFVVTDELVGNAGETVTSILDKLVSLLGNYEYFYDVFGIFHFREIKNYMNHTLGNKALKELSEKDYLVDSNQYKNIFSFSDQTLLTSVNVIPLYENIKNDFIINGTNKNDITKVDHAIRYHLAIDKKPEPLGIDLRDNILTLWDRTEAIKAIEKDIETINSLLWKFQQQDKANKAKLENALRDELNLYHYISTYGDVLKLRLQMTVGDFGLPQNQDISQGNFVEPIFSEKSFYAKYFTDLEKEIKKQNKDNDLSIYMTRADEQIMTQINQGIWRQKKIGTLKDFTQKIYEYITPEAYWGLIRHQGHNRITVVDTIKNYGLLQNEHLLEKIKTHEDAWLEAVKNTIPMGYKGSNSYICFNPNDEKTYLWKDIKEEYEVKLNKIYYYTKKKKILKELASVKDFKINTDYYYYSLNGKVLFREPFRFKNETEINQWLLEAFNFLSNETKNPETGYIKKTDNYIITGDGVDVHKMQDFGQNNLLPGPTLPTLKTLFENDQKEKDEKRVYNKNIDGPNIKKIYSEYFSSLTTGLDIDDNELKSLERKEISLTIQQKNAKSKWKASEKLVKNYKWIKEYMDGLTKTPPPCQEVYYTYKYDKETKSYKIDKKLFLSFDYIRTRLVGKNIENRKFYEKYTADLKQLRKKIKKIKDKKEADTLKSIWEYLSKAYWNYKEEKNKITKKEENVEKLTKTYKNFSRINKTDMNKILKKLECGGHLSYLPVTDGVIPIKGPEHMPKTIKEVLKTAMDTDGTFRIKNKEKFYTMLIYHLEKMIEELKNNPNYEQTDNLHKGYPYYAVFPEDTLILYKEENTNLIKAGFVEKTKERPEIGNVNLFYKGDSTTTDINYYYWDGKEYKALDVKGIFYCPNCDKEDFSPSAVINGAETSIEEVGRMYYAYDWRTALYLQGLYAKAIGSDKGHYFEELDAFWPQTYDLLTQYFVNETPEKENDANRLTFGYYFLDFLDSTETSFGEWSVDNIGRRVDVIHNEKINCLFEPEVPDINILHAATSGAVKNNDGLYAAEDEWNLERLRQECQEEGEIYTQIEDKLYKNMITGGYRNSAYEQLKYELYMHTRYQKSISFSSIPVFYLEPNSRITVADTTTNTFGDFVIQSISLNFGPGANMSISANEILERF